MIELMRGLRFRTMAGAAVLSLLAGAGTARAQDPSPETTEGAPLGEVLSFLLTNQAVATGDFVKDAEAAAMAADAIGGDLIIHVPENGLISLNVPLDPTRLGALSTRTTHPFYMARFCDLLAGLGLPIRLENAYRFQTKGMMVTQCADDVLLKKEARHTMSCSSPAKARWVGPAG